MQNDTPNLWDHDFPHPGYLITTSGYQMQVKQSVCVNQPNKEDELYTRVDLNDYLNDLSSTKYTFAACGGIWALTSRVW